MTQYTQTRFWARWLSLAVVVGAAGCLQEPEPDYTVPRDASADASSRAPDAGRPRADAGLDARARSTDD